jgi:uncharacterized protein YcfJ
MQFAERNAWEKSMSTFFTPVKGLLAAVALAVLSQSAVAAPAHMTAVYLAQHKAKAVAAQKRVETAKAPSGSLQTSVVKADVGRADNGRPASEPKVADAAGGQ